MYVEGILDSITSFNIGLKTMKQKFINNLIQQDLTKEEAEFVLTSIEETLDRINQRRNFSSIFKEPKILPEMPHI